MKKNLLTLAAVVLFITHTFAQNINAEPFELAKSPSKLDTTRTENIIPAVDLIANKAPELNLKDEFMNSVALSNIQTPYVLLVFWDPACKHCIVWIPKMDSLYKKYLRKVDCEVLGINLNKDRKEWTDFMKDKNLEWINAWDPENESDFRKKYSVTSSPTVFILDRSRNVVAKTSEVGKVKGLLDEYIAKNKKIENAALMADGNSSTVESNFNIYPNPFADEFTLYMPEISDKVSVSIFSTDGKTVFVKTYETVNSSLRVDIGDKKLPPGFYLVTVRTDKQTYTRKLVKE